MLINAVKWPPRANHHIVTRDMLKIMKKSILVVDISCDPAGAIETCVPTSHDKPTYEVEGIRHFCVDNRQPLPGRRPIACVMPPFPM